MQDVSAIGPLNIDLLIIGDGPANWEAIPTWDGPADMEMTAAGSVGYTVTNLARLGLSVQVSSCLPDDPLGAFVINSLQRAGVNTDLVDMMPNTWGGIGVYMLLFGSRKRPLAYRLPSHPLWKLSYSPAEVERLLAARLLHCGGYLHFKETWHGATLELFRAAKARGLLTSMDAQFPLFDMQPPWITALEDVLPYADILFCDDNEARNMAGEEDLDAAARRFLANGSQTIVIKQGEHGATLYRQGWKHHQPAIILGELVDSIGAGDTFDAGFLYGLLQNWSAEQSALFAAVAAGFSVTGVGGSQSMPDLQTIMAEVQARL